MIEHYTKFLLPQTMKAHSFDQNLHIEFCVILSSAYIELNRDPEKARDMLEELLAELKAETVHPHFEAKINLGLGKAYRYPEGMSVIMQYFSISELLFVVQYSYSCNLYNHCNSIQVAADA